MGGLHYDGLASYKSYDLAWLGPILYPLVFAVIAQALVYHDMCRATCNAKAEMGPLSRRLTRLSGDAPPPDARVTLITLIVMLSETTFAIFCLLQCIVNFATRSFLGGAAACDLQAFYATYYTFSSVGVFAVATLFGARIVITEGTCCLFKLPIVAAAGVAVHGGALLLAALPLMGVGEYLFATDYCQYNVEGTGYSVLVFVCLLVGLVIIVASTVAVLRVGSKPCVTLPVCSTNGAEAQQSSELRRSTAQLFCASSLYYAASWLTTIVIICLYWANGEVFSSAQWRVYGAQALILHSNQLVVPLLIGLWWRHLMNGVLEKAKTKGVSLDVGSQA